MLGRFSTAARLTLLAAAFAAMSVYMMLHLESSAREHFMTIDPAERASMSSSTLMMQPQLQDTVLVCNGTDVAVDAEMVYWKVQTILLRTSFPDAKLNTPISLPKLIPDDAAYVSPLLLGHQVEQFLTFEYISGGWNNVRMAIECVLVLAHATGRTLVLPPRCIIPPPASFPLLLYVASSTVIRRSHPPLCTGRSCTCWARTVRWASRTSWTCRRCAAAAACASLRPTPFYSKQASVGVGKSVMVVSRRGGGGEWWPPRTQT